ncbi:hypothetical protein BBJ28_00007265 [Nothophytophthora sp. Chile5]|nr:hypothetical protein BBJ28_00007265 [Nothophytophthora sp. Chile5]
MWMLVLFVLQLFLRSAEKMVELDGDHELDEQAAAELVNATSQVAVMRSPGATYLDIRINKIGLKDASVYVNPSIAVSVLNGAAIAFEFFHYKAKKRKKSCRCWALLEMDEVKDGPVVLELYQKPMDPTRKRIHLFTEKELYLQLELRLQTL